MANKQVKVFYYKVDRDISSLLAGFRAHSISQEMSIIGSDKVYQFRDIEQRGNIILGRVCKVLIEGKPTAGEAFKPLEKDMQDDLIFDCHFLYNSTKNSMLIQHNNQTSTAPNTIISRLLVHAYKEELSTGLGIQLFIRQDAIEEVKRNRGEIQTITMAMDQDVSKYLTMASGGSYNDMTSDQMRGVFPKEANLKFKIQVGSLKDGFIDKIYNIFKKGEAKDVTFGMGREKINLKEFAKFDKIDVELTEHKHFDKDDFFHKLVDLNEQAEKDT